MRPKRSAAVKAETAVKRIALGDRKPVEHMDLQTQDDGDKERPAPHRRASVQPETSSQKTPDASSPPPAVRAGSGSSQLQVVIPSSLPPANTVPSNPRSQTISPVQQAPPQFHSPVPQHKILKSQNESLRPPPSFFRNSSGPVSQVQNSYAVEAPQQPTFTQWQDSTRPNPQEPIPVNNSYNPVGGPVQKPNLLQQVQNMNQTQPSMAQPINTIPQLQAQYNGGTGPNVPALTHPQATNSLYANFNAAGPAQRAATKRAEEMTASRPPTADAAAAQSLVKEMSLEEKMHMVELARLASGPQTQQGGYSMPSGTQAPRQQPSQSASSGFGILSMGPAITPQSAPRQQYAPNQPGPPTRKTFPPGHQAGNTLHSNDTMGQQRAVAQDQSPFQTNPPRASSEAPTGLMRPPNQPSIYSTNNAVQSPPNLPGVVAGGPGTATPPSSQSCVVHPTGEHLSAESQRPAGISPESGNSGRPRFKITFDPNAPAQEQQSDDSEGSSSPSPDTPKTMVSAQDGETESGSPKVPKGDSNSQALVENDSNNDQAEVQIDQARPMSPFERDPDPVFQPQQEPIIRQRDMDFFINRDPLLKVDLAQFGQQQNQPPSGLQVAVGEAGEQQYVLGIPDGGLPDMPQNDLPEMQPSGLPQVSPTSFQSYGIDFLDRIQIRNDTMAEAPSLSMEENERRRLSTTLTKTYLDFTSARATENAKAQAQPQTQPSKDIDGCLAVTQLPAAVELALRPAPRTFHEIMTEDDENHCVFCKSESSFGISDSSVWLPVEASPGYCNACHEETNGVFNLWKYTYKLPHGLSPEEKDKYETLMRKSTTTPLKQLGNEADFRAQQKIEMGKPLRQSAISNASRPFMKDGRKDRREHRKDYNLATVVRNLPRGGRLPPRRAVSGGFRLNGTAAEAAPGVVPDKSRGAGNGLQPGTPIGNLPSVLSPLGGPTSFPQNAAPNQAVTTGWTNGVPSALPALNFGPGCPTNRANGGQDRALTPNSAAIMGILGISAPPGATISSTPATNGNGSQHRGRTNTLSPTLSDVSNSDRSNTAQGPSATPHNTGPSGVPTYFNTGPSGSFLHPPPFNSGPVFCRGCPWRQVDFTKAKICTTCRDCKFLICAHTQHLDFGTLVLAPNYSNLTHQGHGLGPVGRDGNLHPDGRYSNCMICTGSATHGCHDCPLRLCGECVVRLVKMCKGKINDLLNFYNQCRDHIRNDAFLLRNDNKGF